MNPPQTIISDSSFTNCNFYSLSTNNNIQGNITNWKINVDAVLTTNNSLYGVQMYQVGQRILATGQTDMISNGIYVVTNKYWKRSNDMKSGISASGIITYSNSDNFYYYCVNQKDSDIVGINELDDRVIVKNENGFATSEIFVINENSLRFVGNDSNISGDNLTFKTFLPNDIMMRNGSFDNIITSTGDINVSTNSAFKGSNIIFDYSTYVYTQFSGSQSNSTDDRSINFNTNDNQSISIGANKNIEFKNGGVSFNVASNNSVDDFGDTTSVSNQGLVTIINDGGVSPLGSNYIIISGVEGSCYACVQSSDNYFNVSVVPNVGGLKLILTNMLDTVSVNSVGGTVIGFIGL
jgi:spore coat protein CotF